MLVGIVATAINQQPIHIFLDTGLPFCRKALRDTKQVIGHL